MSSTEFPGDLSPFRTGFLKVELFIGGAWTDVTPDLGDDGLTLTRGREDGDGQPGPSRMTLRLRSAAGKYSPRNPASPYFGLIGRNTAVRVSTQPTAGGTVFYRFWGEVTQWPQSWTKKGEPSVTVNLECSGVLRRLVQGATPLRSVLYRAITNVGTNLVAYWPLEDGSDAVTLAAAVGNRPITPTGSPSIAAYSGFAASRPIPTLQDGRLVAKVPRYTPAATPVAQIRWIGYIPAATPAGTVLLRAKCSGTLNYVELQYEAAGSFFINGIRDDGTSAGSASGWLGNSGNKKQRVSLEMTQSGANISVTLSRLEVGQSAGVTNTGSFATATLGVITELDFNPTSAAAGDVAIGHVSVEKAITSLFTVSSQQLAGWRGERAHDRIVRLALENGIVATPEVLTAADVTPLGAQGSDELVALMREAADADGGILYEPRSSDDLAYRSLESMYSQAPTATIPYTDNLLLPFEPVDDDQATRNVVTATRAGGTSSTWTQTTGPLGTAAVGVYDDEQTLSLSTDAQCAPQASWRAHMGTHDEARWPTVGLDLAHPTFRGNTGLRDAVLGLDLGDLLRVTDLPPWLPPQSVEAIVQGYTETITPHSWKVEYRCTPARPLRVAKWGTAGDRYSGDGTVLAADITTTSAATFTVTPPAGVTWTHADGDYDVVIGGEEMTVTDVVGNLFTVTRAVNGVAKTHLAGSAVVLADPVFYGLGERQP